MRSIIVRAFVRACLIVISYRFHSSLNRDVLVAGHRIV